MLVKFIRTTEIGLTSNRIIEKGKGVSQENYRA